MSTIELSPLERRILSNQSQILAALYPNEAENHLRTVKVLEEGFEYEYGDLFLGFDAKVSTADCIFVLKVLGMYLDFSISDPANTFVSASDKRFPGFDGNHESGLLSYARFTMSDPNKFRQLQRPDYNSHVSLSAKYREMLAKYDDSKFGQQTEESIREILGK